MAFANRLNDSFKHFIQYVTDPTLEVLVFLWRGLALNSADGIIHLAVYTQENLENVLCGLWIFKQGWLRARTCQFATNDNPA